MDTSSTDRDDEAKSAKSAGEAHEAHEGRGGRPDASVMGTERRTLHDGRELLLYSFAAGADGSAGAEGETSAGARADGTVGAAERGEASTDAGGENAAGAAGAPASASDRTRPDARSGSISELRWDATRGEWIIAAPHRHARTHQPPTEHCPLCPAPVAETASTEVPVETFEIAVFENRFPSLGGVPGDARGPGGPGDEGEGAAGRAASEMAAAGRAASGTTAVGVAPPSPDALHATGAASGRCEVVVYTPEHEGRLGGLSVRRIERLLRVWADRYRELGRREDVRCVFIFENRGPEIGVTLHHPHGQIYAYPFVPPVPARELERERAYADATGGRCLHCDLLEREVEAGTRLVVETDGVVGHVPFAARWPFEVRLAPRAHRPSLLTLDPADRRGLAVGLKRTLQGYDRLFGAPMPYILAVRQAPTPADEGGPGAHLRIELYPARRAADKLKHRAGSETSMGTVVHDVGPENAAVRLREVV